MKCIQPCKLKDYFLINKLVCLRLSIVCNVGFYSPLYLCIYLLHLYYYYFFTFLTLFIAYLLNLTKSKS